MNQKVEHTIYTHVEAGTVPVARVGQNSASIRVGMNQTFMFANFGELSRFVADLVVQVQDLGAAES